MAGAFYIETGGSMPLPCACCCIIAFGGERA